MKTPLRPPTLITGRLRLCLRCPGGPVLAERHAHNAVLRSGAELVAALFSGQAATPINGVAVGLDPTPPSAPYEAGTLTTTAPDGSPLLQLAAVPLAADAMITEVLTGDLKVRVSVRVVIPPSRAVSPDPEVAEVLLGEAALGVLAPEGDRLMQVYNRVAFEPVPKRREHELALYWEVDFPYGV